MTRTIAEIQTQIDNEQAKIPQLSAINSPSQTGIYTLWKNITATGINALEQLFGIYRKEVETELSGAKIGSDAWLQTEIFKFQYSATTPQALTLIEFKPAYATVYPNLQIITRCSVKTMANKTISIKVAKNEPPEALAPAELISLKEYIENISFAGTQKSTLSYNPDLVYIKGVIKFNGQYSGVIADTVTSAINEYFAHLPFNGTFKILGLTDYIQQVQGVSDVVLEDVAIRADGTAFSNKTYLMQGNELIYSTYPTFAGYVIAETEPGETLADRLTFIGE